MDQKEFERDMQVYEISGIFSGLSTEISMLRMGFDLSKDDLQELTDKLNRWQTILALVKSKVEEIKINEILNDD